MIILSQILLESPQLEYYVKLCRLEEGANDRIFLQAGFTFSLSMTCDLFLLCVTQIPEDWMFVNIPLNESTWAVMWFLKDGGVSCECRSMI